MKTSALIGIAVSQLISAAAFGQIPPLKVQTRPPDAYFKRIKQNPEAFKFDQSFLGLVQKIQTNRDRVRTSRFPGLALATANLEGGLLISGIKTIPIVPALYSDSGGAPYAPDTISREYFDGPWPTGTMAEFYSAMSYGNLTVKGIVLDWRTLPHASSYYAGDDYTDEYGNIQHCLGLCPTSRVGELIRDLLDRNPNIDWGQFDNDGPDRKPNSGDDDGFVDFIAIVHEGIGGECEVSDNTAIWSHRGQLMTSIGPYVTNITSRTPGVGNIKINDYVIVPALACDGQTPNPIGVVAHEFGHAFGLPDLYDIDYRTTGGVGDWDLMATGAWGGDDASPQKPTFMSAWSQAFLGWVSPIPVNEDIQDIDLEPIETKPMAYEIGGPGSKHFLLSYRQKTGSDALLPNSGLLLQVVDANVLKAGLKNNRVNVNPSRLGVSVFEASGDNGLTTPLNSSHADRQDAGDVLPISPNHTSLDSASVPPTPGKFALCDIHEAGGSLHARLLISTNTCGLIGNVSESTPSAGMPSQPARTTVNQLAKQPLQFANRVVRLTGVIENTGTNLFTNQSLSFTDSTGRSLPAQLLLATEIPPAAKATKAGGTPKTASAVLGKLVDVTGMLVQTEDDKSPVLRITAVTPKQ